ncbi:MAG: type II secretion system minor pseudopilin GspJ [Candidatus Competibacteraceae bacterium]|jgi:general secretion pathway protein J|nr:type II secretion system minor pseudopilin GspJ [Candidatus Competibacteraceae bacterium]MBK7984317.1 type II secretion system minor pseudopilin GspJ [Candidatus Competibacteraceae bacterium]MBK8896284.1 type II secretion system minor pseudopilin GspJ [Candidatus Competibacteraceae bacterium]MBK8964906.1 type II secretion system minor pseudopilin GspJ [Candidatus Competibacteraceae bacterium]MBK9950187.1 type II secretion system minor pseudopilin GspJ [Candidatus Competibacteraceae bacterium
MRFAARGFTLLELLVALAVFAIMATAAYSGLRNVLVTRSVVETQSRRLALVQLAVFRLEQDIEQAVPRAIRDEYGEPQAALLGGELAGDRLTLTRAGWDNPLGQPRAGLQRVAYRLRDGRLWRLYWDVLDRGGLGEPRETLLLERVREFRVRFLKGKEWQNDWPSTASDGGGGGHGGGIGAENAARKNLDALPRAVEISLTLEDWGEISRLLPLPG